MFLKVDVTFSNDMLLSLLFVICCSLSFLYIKCNLFSSGSRRARSPRQSNQRQHFSIKNSKFWLRILKPWKWKKRSKKSRLNRTGSNSSKTGSQGVHSISTASHLTSPEQYFQAAASLKQTPSIVEGRLDLNSTSKSSIGK